MFYYSVLISSPITCEYIIIIAKTLIKRVPSSVDLYVPSIYQAIQRIGATFCTCTCKILAYLN